jgi:deoxycytidylate deaminase
LTTEFFGYPLKPQTLSPMKEPLPVPNAPELIFGLVAPIGVDLDIVAEVLSQSLKEVNYQTDQFRVTKLMREIPAKLTIAESPYVQSFKDRIAFANEVRRLLGDDALAALAISAIRSFRSEERERRASAHSELPDDAPSADERTEEAPLPNQAYIIRQFKRPEEIALLRRVYGRQFILVSAYAPHESRRTRIEENERRSRGGLISDVDAQQLAHDLVVQDAKEILDKHGQNLRDAFPLGDVFIDATTREKCEVMVRRFVHLLFGNNQITPTHDEYGMYMAKSASLRSSDLSRQVGAAIFRLSSEVVTLGCNEVPKAGGGTYWSGDIRDERDFVQGHDPNERKKIELLVDLIDRLRKGAHLSEPLMKIDSSYEISKALLDNDSEHSIGESKAMDLLEFGRIIHAEMSAICDASRKGISIDGTTLYCTTFPCHMCAKHIVASGIRRVVYLEPYPKSYAAELHWDSIDVDPAERTYKVAFEAFIGVSPYRYRDLFEKGKRKYTSGLAEKWTDGAMRPVIEVYYPSYFKAETHVVAQLNRELERLAGN